MSLSTQQLESKVCDEQFIATITFTHKPNSDDTIPLSILKYVQLKDDVRGLEYIDHQFTLDASCKQFEVEPGVWCHSISKKKDAQGTVQLLQFCISTDISIHGRNMSWLCDWVRNIHQKYLREANDSMGDQRYYFSQKPPLHGQQFPYILFEMREMQTNKSLETLSGPHVNIVRERLKVFADDQWHIDRGLNQNLGMLLYGPPGCGKSTIIKTIAKHTNRHVFSVQLNNKVTKEQLAALFYNEKVTVLSQQGQHALSIPLRRRIYLFEDADCETNSVLLARQPQAPENTTRYVRHRGEVVNVAELGDLYTQSLAVQSTFIDLSFVLNLLDGVLEVPGQMVILTSNFPEKLDPALIRPGRVGVKVCVQPCTLEMIRDMFQTFYFPRNEQHVELSLFSNIMPGRLSPALVVSTMCTHSNNLTAAIDECVRLAPASATAMATATATATILPQPTVTTTILPQPTVTTTILPQPTRGHAPTQER